MKNRKNQNTPASNLPTKTLKSLDDLKALKSVTGGTCNCKRPVLE